MSMTGVAAVSVAPTETAPAQNVEPPPPTASPPPPMHVTGGAPPPLSRERRLEAELAHVRSLLDQRARTTDPTQRHGVEAEIRAASERVVQLSPPASPKMDRSVPGH
jgi:hypothetical protein